MTVAKIETLEQNVIGRHLYPAIGFVEVARQIHYAMPLTETETETKTKTDQPTDVPGH